MKFLNHILRRFIKFLGGLKIALGLELFVGLFLAILTVFLFGWLADEMAEGDTAHFDEAVRNFIHSFASPVLTEIMRAASFAGSTLFLIFLGALIVGLLLWRKHRHGATLFAITTVGAGILLSILKLLFQRARPEPFFDTILPASYSFPSGHSLGSFCFYLALATILSNRAGKFWVRILIWTCAVLLVILIGISRIYLGVHYPSDVVAGFAAGFVWVISIVVADQLVTARMEKVGEKMKNAHKRE